MASTLTIEDIVSEYGKYYMKGGQNEKSILKLMKQPSVTPSHAKPIITENTQYRFATSHFGSKVQQFQKEFTPKGDDEFKPNIIQLRQGKVDYSFYPDDLTESWLGFLSSIDEGDRSKWPSVRYMIENAILPQIPHDMELQAYGKGEYAEPTKGVAGTAKNVLDGLVKITDDGLANSDSPMNNVVLTKTGLENGVEFIESFLASILPLYLDNFKFKILADPVFVRNYQTNYRDRFNQSTVYSDNRTLKVDFHPNVELVSLPSLTGTNRMIATPTENFLYVRRKNGINAPVIQADKREVIIMTDWWEALGFGYNELVWVYKG